MALQFRKGSSAQLQGFVPLPGEPIFTTDSKKLFVGDGITPGGIEVSVAGGLGGALSSSINLNNNNIVGFGDINIDGLIQTTGQFNGDLIGNVTGNLIGNVSGTLIGNLVGDVVGVGPGSPILVDSINGQLTGPFVGDILSPSDGNIVLDNQSGQAIFYGTVSGNLIGDVIGDVTGDVRAIDSTILVDAVNSRFSTGNLSIFETVIGPTIKSNSNEIILESDFEEGAQVRINFEMVSTIGGNLLTGAANLQYFDLRGWKNGPANPGDPESGDILSAIGFSGHIASTGAEPAALLGVQIDPAGTMSGSHLPTKFTLVNQPATAAEASLGNFPFLCFDSLGRLAVNQQNAQATLDVNGFAKLAILSEAPTNPLDGMIAIADGDSTNGWDPLGLGSPYKQQMVVRLGGSWIIVAQEP